MLINCVAYQQGRKLADIAVLSKDIMTIPDAEIPTAVVELTIVGGKVVFETR